MMAPRTVPVADMLVIAGSPAHLGWLAERLVTDLAGESTGGASALRRKGGRSGGRSDLRSAATTDSNWGGP
jgi:hypothetical protein